jgi:hypothetical protein
MYSMRVPKYFEFVKLFPVTTLGLKILLCVQLGVKSLVELLFHVRCFTAILLCKTRSCFVPVMLHRTV